MKDSPRIPKGLIQKSYDQFKKIDPQRITGDLLEVFSANIEWEQDEVVSEGKSFGIFKILESSKKPVIAKKNYGKNQVIKSGEIYYRYAGRTQRIQYAELEEIVQLRIQKNTEQWMNLMSKIAKVGPQNAAVLKIEGDTHFDPSNDPVFALDKESVEKIKSLNLVEEGQPIIRVLPKLKENLLTKYPLSATELANTIKEKLPNISINKVWETIKKHKMKDNTDYSVYNFRNKKQEDQFKESGKIPKGIPNIYNRTSVNFILHALKNEGSGTNSDNQDS